MSRRVLLMYISEISGHHCASLAVEKALKAMDPGIEIRNINGFNYTNPMWERIINRAYMSVVKNAPEIWDYLYDNPAVLRRTRRLRELIHKAQTQKLSDLFSEFSPDVVACTQAYPCGMVADYKKTAGVELPLVGILTDYAPHSYWVYDNIDAYVVPDVDVGRKLIRNGVLEYRIKPLGIPIDLKFGMPQDRDAINRELGLDDTLPKILLMGGGQGLGNIRRFLGAVDRIKQEFQILVVTGSNEKLYKWIKNRRFKKKVAVFGYVDFVEKLMEVSSLIITKPGGMTTAEALAKNLPMVIIDPLPGQEAMNTKFLLEEGVALKAVSEYELAELIDWLLGNPGKLRQIYQNIQLHKKPDAAAATAKLILELT